MFSIDQFVSDCLEAVHDDGRHGATAVNEVLERAVSASHEVEAALGSPADSPVFSTWFTSDELTVLNVIWPPAVDLMAHDHKMWATIGLYGGREDNRLFRVLPEGHLEQRGQKTLLGGDTVVLGDDTVHAVANPSKEWTGAIHVYGGDYFTSGRRLWLDESRPPIEFDATHVMDVLDDAAEKARQ